MTQILEKTDPEMNAILLHSLMPMLGCIKASYKQKRQLAPELKVKQIQKQVVMSSKRTN